MTNRLDELRGLLDAATPGPWSIEVDPGHCGIPGEPDEPSYVRGVMGAPYEWHDDTERADWVLRFDDDYGTDQAANAALIVFLRNHADGVPEVARAVEALANAARRMVSGLEPESECTAGCTPGSTGPDTEGPWQCESHYLADALSGYDAALARLSPTSEEGS